MTPASSSGLSNSNRCQRLFGSSGTRTAVEDMAFSSISLCICPHPPCSDRSLSRHGDGGKRFTSKHVCCIFEALVGLTDCTENTKEHTKKK
uniref:Uncharacterized protein n=1 Tax=Anguilla anguilla TaxID=7936 RepID=A0A0E9WTS3_ANGAN